MSKKAKEVVEAAPKFAQPWQGLLVFGTVILIAYLAFDWFFSPVTGFFTKMVQANAFVLYQFFNTYTTTQFPGTLGTLGIIFALNNPQEMTLYPLGYILNWVSYFVLCIVWFITIAVLARPFTPPKSRIGKQPYLGLIFVVISMVVAFIMWYVLAIVLKWQAEDITLLGTIGFAVFPVWATLFMYWPFIPKRPQTHAIIRGAVFAVIAWVIAFLIRYIALAKMQTGSIVTVYSQMYASSLNGNALFLMGIPLTTITPTEPWDFVASIFFAIIVGNTIMATIAPFPNMSQPKRGAINWIIAIIIGLIMWGILAETVAPTTVGVLVAYPSWTGVNSLPYLGILPVPETVHANITAYLTFPLVILLFGSLTFTMWPWAKWGIKGNVAFVVFTFIIATIIYYVIMVNPGYAASITGANQIPSASGLQSLYLDTWLQGLQTSFIPGGAPFAELIMWDYLVEAVAFEGVGVETGFNIMFAWLVTVVIFWLLIGEGFEHWPFK